MDEASSWRGRGRGGFRGRGRGSRGRGSRSHHEHDDRDRPMSLTERLGERIGYKGRGRDRRGRRGGNFARGRGATQYVRQDPKKIIWYQVTIPFGKHIEKTFIYESINELIGEDYTFDPQMFRTEGEAAVFFVQLSGPGADALKSLTKRITLPNQRKMCIIAKPSDPPLPKTIEGELLEKLQGAMSNRYDSANKLLDLSAFHRAPELRESALPLNRNMVMGAVVKIITEHIPEVVGLNLSGNRLKMLDNLARLVSKTPNMVALDLSNNDIPHEAELDKLKGWKNLEEIHLKDTPFFLKFKDTASYLSVVRKKFPRVIKLDGEDAPMPVGFDVAEEDELPASKGNFLGMNPTVQNTVTVFVDQYIKLFDSGNRAGLENAYHEKATFSVCFYYDPNYEGKQAGFDYIRNDSRNLTKINDNGRKVRSLKLGRSKCVSFLLDYPSTTHNLETLTVDIVNDADELPTFTVCGLMEEKSDSHSYAIWRIFTHNFVLVPQGAGHVIISQQLCLSNISKHTKEMMINAARQRHLVAPVPQSSVTPSASTSTQAPTAVAYSPEQQVMVQEFMKNSGMNAEWSAQCLESKSWDMAQAAEAFTTLKAQGSIPSQAFM